MTGSAESRVRARGQPVVRLDVGEHLRLSVVGMSFTDACGVRDHATLLAAALARENIECSLHWLERRATSLKAERAELAGWAHELEVASAEDPPDAVLLHYSVFAHSHRGLPVFVPRMMSALADSEVPVIAFMHELVFPWRRRGVRGTGWAASQRLALAAVMRRSAAVVVTVQERRDWLASRAWLPRRPLAVAPVFSTLPPPAGVGTPREQPPGVGGGETEGEEATLGIFGYTYRPAAVSLVLDALAALRGRGRAVRLVLLGAPGRESPIGEMWASTADSRSLAAALSFSGAMIPAQDLSDELAGCDLLLFADGPGPTSRKTTLAGALASGTPVLALDGPSSWRELIDAGAVELVEPSPRALAAATERLLDEPGQREAIAARGRAFAAERMGVARSAAVVAELLVRILTERGRLPAAGGGSAPGVGDRRPGAGALAVADRT